MKEELGQLASDVQALAEVVDVVEEVVLATHVADNAVQVLSAVQAVVGELAQ